MDRPFPTTERQSCEAFVFFLDHTAKGYFALDDVRGMIKVFDQTYTEEDIANIMASLSGNETGCVTWKEFKHISTNNNTHEKCADATVRQHYFAQNVPTQQHGTIAHERYETIRYEQQVPGTGITRLRTKQKKWDGNNTRNVPTQEYGSIISTFLPTKHSIHEKCTDAKVR